LRRDIGQKFPERHEGAAMASARLKESVGSVPPPVEWASCGGCAKRERTSGLIRLANPVGRERRCFDCYLAETGGQWRPRDLYWDGRAWIPLRKGG